MPAPSHAGSPDIPFHWRVPKGYRCIFLSKLHVAATYSESDVIILYEKKVPLGFYDTFEIRVQVWVWGYNTLFKSSADIC